jgi:hypothetical protein
MMPELDSHAPSLTNPTPLDSKFSPWHACGAEYERYSAGMKRCAHLRLQSVTLRLAPGQTDVQGAAQQWQDYFGVQRQNDRLHFTNAHVQFAKGEYGKSEGLENIVVEVAGQKRFDRLLETVRQEGLCGDGWTDLLGVKWYFVLKREDDVGSPHEKSKL